MSRNKKSRKVGAEASVAYSERTVSQSELDARLRKKTKKRKGLKAGTRHSDAEVTGRSKSKQQKDPRLGSKKLIPLVVAPKAKPGTVAAKKERRLSAEQELDMLENDAQLTTLLDRLDEGEKLGSGLQKYVDEKLDRIERLMGQLGLLEEDEPETEVVEVPVKRSKKKTDEDLLEQFANLDMDDFKE
ncbi:MAG: GTPase-activating protein [Aliivibrio sp.]|uniref:Der GTPase-activating protein YihI n=1 Tax=Aliivibrio sp. TaxID=1872443 RepID=UPI001A530B5D|nr:GTPase-activating protein [Aliivibrio sp.]